MTPSVYFILIDHYNILNNKSKKGETQMFVGKLKGEYKIQWI
jgi:hypothetical protein